MGTPEAHHIATIDVFNGATAWFGILASNATNPNLPVG
jgi:hypothetical protein